MDANEPVHLFGDAETGDRFLVYDSEKGLKLDIRYEADTLWMTQEQIARLFGRDRTVITKHIANILEEGELDEASCVQKMHTSTGTPSTPLQPRYGHFRWISGVVGAGHALPALGHFCARPVRAEGFCCR